MGKFRFREVVVCANKLTNPRSFPSGSEQYPKSPRKLGQ
jgi:hypothetical protein